MFSFERPFVSVVAGLAIALIGQQFHPLLAAIWSSWQFAG